MGDDRGWVGVRDGGGRLGLVDQYNFGRSVLGSISKQMFATTGSFAVFFEIYKIDMICRGAASSCGSLAVFFSRDVFVAGLAALKKWGFAFSVSISAPLRNQYPQFS